MPPPHRNPDLERLLELEKLLRQHEQKQEQLRDALGHFNQLLESAPDVIYTLARDGSITSLNPAFEAITGWTVAEWLGRNFQDLMQPEDRVRARSVLEAVLRGDGPDLHVLRIRNRNGEFSVGEFTVRPLMEHGSFVGWFGIVRDITKRVRAEEALRAREAEYRRLFEEAPVGIFRSSAEGKPLLANPALVKMLGYDSLDDLLARDIVKEGYHPATPRSEFLECIQETGEVRGFEAKWLKKDGTVLHVRENAHAVRDAEGRIVEYEGTVEDETATVLAQEKLHRALDELQALFRAMPDLYFRLRRDGTILDCMAGRSEDLYLTPEQFLGRRMQEVLPPAAGALVSGALRDLEKGKDLVTIEYALPLAGGEEYFEARMLPLLRDQVMVIAHNITKRKGSERALMESEERFRHVTEAALVGVYLVQDGKFQYVNPAFSEMFGYAVDEIEGRLASVDLTHPDDRDLVTRQVQARLSRTMEAGRYTFRGLRKDGSVIQCEAISRYLELHGRPAIIGTVLDITEKMRFVEALQTSEARFRAIIDLTPNLAIEAYDRNGRVLMWNAAAERLYGWKESEVLGRTLDEFLLDASWNREFASTLAAIDAGELPLWEGEYPFRNRTGGEGQVQSTIFAIPGPSGERQFICMDIDVTARNRAEEALRESEARLQEAQRVAKLGAYQYDIPTGRWTSSAVLDEIFGIGPDHPRKVQDWLDLVHPQDRAEMTLYLDRMLRERLRFEKEYRILRPDGQMRWVEGLGELHLDAAGNPLKLVGTIQDISQSKRAEEELRRTTERLQLQFDRMPIGCILWDADWRVVSWNPAAQGIFGFTQEEVLGQRPIEWIVPREARPQIDSIMARLGEGDESAHSVNENCTKDGRTVLCDWTNTPLKEPDGRIIGVLSMVEDITDRRRAEAALQESVGTLRRTLATTITTMAKIVETKDPYTAGHQQKVAELAELIARELGLTPDRVQGLHMAAMIHDIGKIYIPAEILSKPGQLTRIEIDMIRTHPNFGAEIVKTIPFPWPLAEMILQHHERLDGSGYPRGLKGDEILLESRILMVADVVEAMATHRPYRAARGLIQALQEIQDFRGRYYDPEVVDACLTVIRQGLFSVDTEGVPGRFT